MARRLLHRGNLGTFSASDKTKVAILVLSLVPFVAVVFLGYQTGNPLAVALATGLAIATAGFALAWGTESLQFIVSQVLALAVLAVVQVVPEYSVEVVLAYRGTTEPALLSIATAAMTGANRLLLGLGWPTVYLFSYISLRRSGKARRDIVLERQQGVAVFFLGVATLYSFVVVLRASLGPVDAVALVAIFAAYLYLAKRLPPQGEERIEELGGPSLAVAKLTGSKRIVAIASFVIAGGLVFAFASEPFVRSFLALAASFDVNQYLFIQWLTPVLTELPEAVTVFIWAARTGKGSLALANLVSSKLNQWTMLVSTIPIVYALALGRFQAIPLSHLQVEELFLTASQSVYGFICLMDLRLSFREAAQLFVLFAIQLFVPSVRIEVAALYLILAAAELGVTRGRIPVVREVESLLREHIH